MSTGGVVQIEISERALTWAGETVFFDTPFTRFGCVLVTDWTGEGAVASFEGVATFFWLKTGVLGVLRVGSSGERNPEDEGCGRSVGGRVIVMNVWTRRDSMTLSRDSCVWSGKKERMLKPLEVDDIGANEDTDRVLLCVEAIELARARYERVE